MLLTSILIFVLLVFPIKISIWAILKIKDGRMYFKTELFRFIKLVGGYASLCKEGIVFHIKSNKAIILPYKKLVKKKISLRPINGVNVVKINSITNLLSSNYFSNYVICLGYNTLINTISSLIVSKKPFLNLNNNIDIICTNNDSFDLNSYLLLEAYLNVFALLEYGIKKLLEKIVNVFKKR